MPQIKSLKIATRFGPRYGKRNRDKYASIEKIHRSTHKCPYCHYTAVRRLSAGIWECRKCNATFTGKAYSPAVLKKTKEEITEEVPETKEQDQEEEEEKGVKAPDKTPEPEEEEKLKEEAEEFEDSEESDESEEPEDEEAEGPEEGEK